MLRQAGAALWNDRSARPRCVCAPAATAFRVASSVERRAEFWCGLPRLKEDGPGRAAGAAPSDGSSRAGWAPAGN